MAYKARIALTIILVGVVAIAMSGESDGRELRPSDHGLEYQESPPPGNGKSPEMMSFFAGAGRSSGLSPSSSVALPKALNSSDTLWWSGGRGGGGGGGGGGGRRDHVRQVLVVASVACGITGVALLVASAFIYLFRYKKQKKSSSSSASLPPPNDNSTK